MYLAMVIALKMENSVRLRKKKIYVNIEKTSELDA